ncbi:hypothetical protein D3C87_1853400 [compost metagenome]
MAWAEIAADPILAQVDRGHFRTERRRAAQVRAQTYQDQDLRLDRADYRIDVGRLNRCLGIRVSQLAGDFPQILQNHVGSTNNEYRLAAPFSNHLLTRLDLADIDLHRCTSSLCLGTREP